MLVFVDTNQGAITQRRIPTVRRVEHISTSIPLGARCLPVQAIVVGVLHGMHRHTFKTLLRSTLSIPGGVQRGMELAVNG